MFEWIRVSSSWKTIIYKMGIYITKNSLIKNISNYLSINHVLPTILFPKTATIKSKNIIFTYFSYFLFILSYLLNVKIYHHLILFQFRNLIDKE